MISTALGSVRLGVRLRPVRLGQFGSASCRSSPSPCPPAAAPRSPQPSEATAERRVEAERSESTESPCVVPVSVFSVSVESEMQAEIDELCGLLASHGLLELVEECRGTRLDFLPLQVMVRAV